MKLLNPGPVSMTERVRRALLAEDVCHREPEFKAVVARVRKRLADVYAEPGFVPVLLGGSGTAAVEAMLSLVAPHENALVVANGVYGERMTAMLRAQGKPNEIVSAPWTSAVDVAAVERALATNKYGHLLVVHHETTTGRLNDLAPLGALCKKHDVPMLVDAVSSFAGEEIRFADWNIEAVAATANKCLHGAPGVAFVLARREALERPSGATSVYLDLHRHAAAQDKNDTPFTLPTHVTYALDEALAELADEGGWRARHATYRARSTHVRNLLAGLGITLLLECADDYGSTLTSFRVPQGRSYEAIHAHLKSEGFVIYAGQGKFDGQIFRIAVMGELDGRDLERLSAALRSALS
ncbi:MAG TPA: aminotransferase class V-fold PLP-dependent enzyme [Labilithrix sp.]